MFKMQYLFRYFFQSYYPIIISLGFVVFLLGLRILITDSFFYSFLLWNLFLAAIPYGISQLALMSNHAKIKKHIKIIIFVIWLLFLPNAPYLITDIIHLHNPNSNWLWFDLFMMFAFACNGLLLFVLSLSDAIELLRPSIPKKWVNLFVMAICILSGYGMYLGRFLRFNSWDILLKPKHLLFQILNSFTYSNAILMTLAFGLFLWIFFMIFRWMKQRHHHQQP